MKQNSCPFIIEYLDMFLIPSRYDLLVLYNVSKILHKIFESNKNINFNEYNVYILLKASSLIFKISVLYIYDIKHRIFEAATKQIMAECWKKLIQTLRVYLHHTIFLQKYQLLM